jgi:hypothetical protein
VDNRPLSEEIREANQQLAAQIVGALKGRDSAREMAGFNSGE